MKHRRMIVFIYLLLSVAAYVLFAHWMWDGGTLGMLDPAEAGVLLLLYYLLTASILTVILLWETAEPVAKGRCADHCGTGSRNRT